MNSEDVEVDRAGMFIASDAPAWFREAVAQIRSDHEVDSSGTALHIAGWNASDVEKPPLLLVHGFLGNAHWWDHIAPFFTESWRVFAMDLSGMGKSGHRRSYDLPDFAGDVIAAARWLKKDAPDLPLTVAGHSFGGSRVLQSCVLAPGLIEHAIAIDSWLPLRGDQRSTAERRRSVGDPYPDQESILARFRLVPEQPALAYARHYIARRSIVDTGSGWVWQFDPELRNVHLESQARDDELRRIEKPGGRRAGESTVPS